MNQVVDAKVGGPEAARAQIAAALAAGEAARARELIDHALVQWPKNFGLRMQQAEATQQLGAPLDAVAAYLALGREGAGSPWPLIRAIKVLRETGDLDQAREIFAAEVWGGAAPEDAKLRALAWVVTPADDGEPAAAYLERLAAVPAPAPFVEALARLAELRARQGREADARAALSRIGDVDGAPARARAVEADLLLAEGRSTELLPLAAALAAEQPDQVAHARRLVGALAMAGDQAGAAEALAAALERWPGDWVLLGRLNTLSLSRECLKALVSLVAARGDPAKMPEISRFQLALGLLNVGETERALELLKGIAAAGATGVMATPLRRVLELAPPEWWLTRSRLDDDGLAEVQIVRSPGARSVLLVFAGLNRGHSHLPFSYLDALLAHLPAHVVYLRDGSCRGFLTGIESIGSSEAEAAASLRGLLANLGAERLVGLGSSVGGYAAARYGALLGMEAVALQSAPTTFERELIAGERNSPYNRLNLLRKFGKAFAGEGAGADLVELFAANPGMAVSYYYGEGTERGERNAARLNGLANVRLRAIPDTPHASLPLDVIGTPVWTDLLTRDLGLGG